MIRNARNLQKTKQKKQTNNNNNNKKTTTKKWCGQKTAQKAMKTTLTDSFMPQSLNVK